MSTCLLTILILLLGVPSLPVEARTLHVKQGSGCSDSGPGSIERPWCTIAVAARRAKYGDHVLIHPGTYREFVLIKISGSKGKPIIFEGKPGAHVDGKTVKLPDYAGLVHIHHQRYIEIRGLTISNSRFYGLHALDAKDVVIEGNVVELSNHGGIVVDEGSRRVKVLNNEVRRTNRLGARKALHEAITFSNAHKFEAAYNHIHDCLEEGIDAKDGSTYGQIHHNHVERVGSVAVYLNHARRIKVYNNRIHHNRSTGIQLTVGDGAEGKASTSQNLIYRNQIWDNRANGIEFWRTQIGKMDYNRIYHNVMLRNRHSGIVLDHATGTIVRNNIIVYNRHYGIHGNAVGRSTISHNLFFKNRYGGSPGSPKLTRNPRFVSLKKPDLRLKDTSPAIDGGKHIGMPFKGLAPDMGAFEMR